MSISALVLDFGGVISKTMFETHSLTERELGLDAGTLTWRGPFDPQQDNLWQQMQAQQISERDYWLQRSFETGALLGEQWQSMQDLVRRARGNNPMDVIRPQFLNAISAAKNAGVRLAILSNELDLFYGADFRAKLPFLADFELIVDATYNNVLKPDAKAYAFITEGMALDARECLFVDDQQRNIDGAAAIGMHCHQFDVLNPQASYATVLDTLGVKS
ncbi:MAG: HAD-superfamily hydrolase [Osedax symbiont Rs2]|nr:MAG: HAD-superfamily hydrolase [Osedax symbiont Rs2]